MEDEQFIQGAHAIERRDDTLRRLLQEHPGVVTERIVLNDDQFSPCSLLEYAVAKENLSAARVLLECGAKTSCASMRFAASQGSVEIIRLLVEYGAEVDSTTDDHDIGTTPLMTAILHDEEESVQVLLTLGADPTLSDNDGLTPLANAISRQNVRIVRDLVRGGADVNAHIQGVEDYTPLHIAIRRGSCRIVQALLDGNANVNAIVEANSRSTPLHVAVRKNNGNVIRMLLLMNADTQVRDDHGFTPFKLAHVLQNIESVFVFLQENPIECLAALRRFNDG